MTAGEIDIARVSIEETLRRGEAALRRSSESARLDALLLLAHAMGQPREWIIGHTGEPMSDSIEAKFVTLCQRRLAGSPIAYILGSAGFYKREFIVDERVLIPRPETEHLVDEALEFIGRRKQREHQAMRVVDVGTGSGAIACTIAMESDAIVDATDVSSSAIAVAEQNARRLNVTERCRFYCVDLSGPVAEHRYDVVIANLPYIPTADVPQAPNSASFEPRVALDGGPDGLSLYRRLIPRLSFLISDPALILLEAAPPTVPGLSDLVGLSFPQFTISVGHDYAGLSRYVKAIR